MKKNFKLIVGRFQERNNNNIWNEDPFIKIVKNVMHTFWFFFNLFNF